MITDDNNIGKSVAGLALAGLLAGLGTLLASKEVLTARIVIGRALSSLVLGVGAASILVWIPNISYLALVGTACVIASLGTSTLERLFQKFMDRG